VQKDAQILNSVGPANLANADLLRTLTILICFILCIFIYFAVQSTFMYRFLFSIMHATEGLFHLITKHRNAQIQVGISILVLSIALVLKVKFHHILGIIGSCTAVLAAEAFNSSLETLCNHIHPHIHQEIRFVKDLAAGAVLLVCMGALCYGVYLVSIYRFNIL
jgi:diacylglycerol kinase